MADIYRPGDFYRICDRCGYKVHASQTARTWDNLWVHRVGCFETRHPQDFVRGRVDVQAVREARPEATDTFLDTNEVTAESL